MVYARTCECFAAALCIVCAGSIPCLPCFLPHVRTSMQQIVSNVSVSVGSYGFAFPTSSHVSHSYPNPVFKTLIRRQLSFGAINKEMPVSAGHPFARNFVSLGFSHSQHSDHKPPRTMVMMCRLTEHILDAPLPGRLGLLSLFLPTSAQLQHQSSNPMIHM